MASSILIVEDDEALRLSLTKTLSAIGLSVIQTANGEQALEYLSDHPKCCDVVLLDLNKPGLGGVGTCRRIRETYPLLGIIVLTLSADIYKPAPAKSRR